MDQEIKMNLNFDELNNEEKKWIYDTIELLVIYRKAAVCDYEKEMVENMFRKLKEQMNQEEIKEQFPVKLRLMEGYRDNDKSTRKLFQLSVSDRADANYKWRNYRVFTDEGGDNVNPMDDGKVFIHFFEMGHKKALEGKKYEIEIQECIFEKRETS